MPCKLGKESCENKECEECWFMRDHNDTPAPVVLYCDCKEPCEHWNEVYEHTADFMAAHVEACSCCHQIPF